MSQESLINPISTLSGKIAWAVGREVADGGGELLLEWWPKVKVGGIFAGHDYSPAWPKTIEEVDKFEASHPHVKIKFTIKNNNV